MAIKLGGLLLVVGQCAAVAWWGSGTRRAPIGGWEVGDLVAHLDDRGLQVRAVSAMCEGPLSQGAYLTVTDRRWAQLNCMVTSPEKIEDWEGTVYCFRSNNSSMLALWGDCGQRAGPFVLFGDRALRARISEVLHGEKGVRLISGFE